MQEVLSLPQARRIALAAQGLDKVRPAGPVTARAVGRTFARLQLVQIDSVNVLSRSHYLPFFSRLGNYDRAILQRMAGTHPRRMMEYWAHEASFIRPDHFQDLVLWQSRKWVGAHAMDPELRSGVAARVLEALAAGRPMTAAELTARLGHVEDRQQDNWGWNWNVVKRVLEHLFEAGLISASSRTESFERRYTLTARSCPNGRTMIPALQPMRTPGRTRRPRWSASSMPPPGPTGSARCGALRITSGRPCARPPLPWNTSSTPAGCDPSPCPGWNKPVYRHVEAKLPRTATGRALLSPFDSLVFERRRLEDLFGFHYRIEIYTPEPKRRFGYYVLPFLLRDGIVARVDLKADRANGLLLARAAHAEPGAPDDTAVELAAELQLMAEWLELDGVIVSPKGDLAPALADAVSKAGSGVSALREQA